MAKEVKKPAVDLNAEKDKSIKEALAQIHKKYGIESVVELDKDLKTEVEVVSTGCFDLDEAFGCGGMPKGRILEIFGEESCMHPDTFINYDIRTKEGESQNSKGGTIERLYNRFHNIPIEGQGNYHRKQTENADFYVPSINENNGVIKNKVLDVVSCGIKDVYKVSTVGGKSVICTAEHKFYVGDGEYAPLSELEAGFPIYVHNNTTVKGRKPQIRYKEIFVKYHPTATTKIVNKCLYYRVKRSHAVVEANKNGMSLLEYVDLLNTTNKKDLNSLYTIPKGTHVHHKNFNPLDDSLKNLVLLNGKEHNRLHALNNGDKLNFVVTEDIIKSIKSIGSVNTYDIKCQAPYNNYIANKIVVHNSGKSTLATFLMAQVQKNGGRAALIDAEFAFDAGYARTIGLDISKLILSQPGCLEEAMDVLNGLVKSNGLDIIVIDSVAALVPRSEIEGEEMLKDSMAVQARLMGKALRIVTGSIARSKTIVIFINQTRDKVGVFYGAKTTQPGGKALKFFASVRIDVKKGDKIEGSDKELIGYTLKTTMVKNKVGYPWRQAMFDLYFGTGVDLMADAVDYGEKIGIIEKTGNSYAFGDVKLGIGRANAIKTLKGNNKLYSEVIAEIKKEVAKGPKKKSITDIIDVDEQ